MCPLDLSWKLELESIEDEELFCKRVSNVIVMKGSNIQLDLFALLVLILQGFARGLQVLHGPELAARDDGWGDWTVAQNPQVYLFRGFVT